MAYSPQQLDAIFEKTNGRCHICRKTLARQSYGTMKTPGAWEVDHSVPQAKGGTDRLGNLLPACISCNRSKQDSSTETARRKHGFRASPLSKKKKTDNTWLGTVAGGTAGWIVLASLGPLGIVIGTVSGMTVGYFYEPK